MEIKTSFYFRREKETEASLQKYSCVEWLFEIHTNRSTYINQQMPLHLLIYAHTSMHDKKKKKERLGILW